MTLPNVDFELAYWRARRRTQRLRSAVRELLRRLRSAAQLRVLVLSMQPYVESPEETIVYRALWAIALAGVALVLSIEVIGEVQFLALVDAIFGRSA
jgi:uncharacterized membrane protein